MVDKKKIARDYVEASRLTSVGVGLLISVMIGWFIGNTIDNHFHTVPVFMVIFVILGMGAGLLNVFRTLGNYGDKRRDRPDNRGD
jgi:F0F1-type ATP synthase assembly protein I